MSLPTPPTLAPVPDTLPVHTAYGVDGLAHHHGPGCFWDLAECGWHCAPAVATTPPEPGPVIDPGCPDVA